MGSTRSTIPKLGAQRTLVLSVLGVCASILAGCGGGLRARIGEAARVGDFESAWRDYEAVRQSDGDDVDLLALVAEALLVRQARDSDPVLRTAAVGQLVLAGTRGREPLERLAQGPIELAIEALEALTRTGARDAQRLLRGLADAFDPRVRAAAAFAMSATDDRRWLEAACIEPSARVRETACARLADLAPDSDVLVLLAERARRDPEPAVRIAAALALGRFGASAVLVLRDRLSDPDPRVRSAALEALLRADRQEGRSAVASILEMPTSAVTIEAARLLATPLDRSSPPSSDDLASARTHLAAALTHPDPVLRARAAVALGALRLTEEFARSLLPRVEEEPDVGVRATLCRVLSALDAAREPAIRCLRRAMAEDHGMVGTQAAVALVTMRNEEGLERLRADLEAPSTEVRRVAARALAREALRPVEVQRALSDPDALVRIHAAGGILAARAAMGR